MEDALHAKVNIEGCLSKLPKDASNPALARVHQAHVDDSPLWKDFSLNSAARWTEFMPFSDEANNQFTFLAADSQANKDAEQDKIIDQLSKELKKQKELSEKREQYW
jgi:hypothetical protein